jgi:zinc protease
MLSLAGPSLAERLYPLSARLSAVCHKEVTVFTGQVHQENLMKFLPLLGAIIAVPRLRQDELDRVRNEAIGGLSASRREMSDTALAARGLESALYRGHPYGHAEAGTVESLRAITLDDVQRFHRAHYTRDALLIGLGGNADPAIVDYVRGLLSQLPTAPFAIRPLPEPEPLRGIDVTLVEKPVDTAAIAVGFPLRVSWHDDDFYALAVARAYLDEQFPPGGTLAHAAVLALSSSPIVSTPDDPRRQQAFTFHLDQVPHDQVARAVRTVLGELDRLARDGLTDDQFAATRARLLTASKFWGRTLSQRLGLAMEGTFHGCNDIVTELDRRLAGLSASGANAAFRRHLAPTGIKVVAVTRDARGLEVALLSSSAAPPSRTGTEQVNAAFALREMRVEVVMPGRPFPLEP